MKDFLHSKLFFFLAIALAVCIGLMVCSALLGGPSPFSDFLGSVITPFQKLVNVAGDGISNIAGYFYRYNSLLVENEKLKAELEKTRGFEMEYYTLLTENRVLKELCGLQRTNPELLMVPAAIVSRPDSSLNVTFTVDKGTRNGVKKGDSVISSSGLVGYVSSAGLLNSEVTYISDMSVSVSAVICRTGETVVANGDFSLSAKGLIRLSYLNTDCDIKPGDMIKTSGFGDIYPKNIMIGRVTAVGMEPHGMSAYAEVTPFFDPATENTVYIVTDKGE